MPVSFLRQTLKENPALFRLINRYYCEPARMVHPARITKEIPPNVFSFLLNSRLGRRRLHRCVGSHWSLEFDADFSEPRHRLLLLSPSECGLLSRYCGAALHAPAITKIIDRTTKKGLTDYYGEEIHEFVLRRASMLINKLPAAMITERFEIAEVESIEQAGRNCLRICMHDLPVASRNRAELLLPDGEIFADGKSPQDDVVSKIWSFVTRILFTEISTELKPCFV